jgi:hypothetical protein
MNTRYINSEKPLDLYLSLTKYKFFIDKSLLIGELFDKINMPNRFLCLTRPRRFGKSCMAHMIASFFSKTVDSHTVFERLAISGNKDYTKYIGKYNIVFINFRAIFDIYGDFFSNYSKMLNSFIQDAIIIYPDINFSEITSIYELFEHIYSIKKEKFIFVFDEWDAIFQTELTVDDKSRKGFLNFLNALLKDQPYVELAYMTGIMPIAKYSMGSDLNMFDEYNMATDESFSGYFGFTKQEVESLHNKYLQMTKKSWITMEGLKFWYDGYETASGESLYNPYSITKALERNKLDIYWQKSGPYDSLYRHIKNNDATVNLTLL